LHLAVGQLIQPLFRIARIGEAGKEFLGIGLPGCLASAFGINPAMLLAKAWQSDRLALQVSKAPNRTVRPHH